MNTFIARINYNMSSLINNNNSKDNVYNINKNYDKTINNENSSMNTNSFSISSLNLINNDNSKLSHNSNEKLNENYYKNHNSNDDNFLVPSSIQNSSINNNKIIVQNNNKTPLNNSSVYPKSLDKVDTVKVLYKPETVDNTPNALLPNKNTKFNVNNTSSLSIVMEKEKIQKHNEMKTLKSSHMDAPLMSQTNPISKPYSDPVMYSVMNSFLSDDDLNEFLNDEIPHISHVLGRKRKMNERCENQSIIDNYNNYFNLDKSQDNLDIAKNLFRVKKLKQLKSGINIGKETKLKTINEEGTPVKKSKRGRKRKIDSNKTLIYESMKNLNSIMKNNVTSLISPIKKNNSVFDNNSYSNKYSSNVRGINVKNKIESHPVDQYNNLNKMGNINMQQNNINFEYNNKCNDDIDSRDSFNESSLSDYGVYFDEMYDNREQQTPNVYINKNNNEINQKKQNDQDSNNNNMDLKPTKRPYRKRKNRELNDINSIQNITNSGFNNPMTYGNEGEIITNTNAFNNSGNVNNCNVPIFNIKDDLKSGIKSSSSNTKTSTKKKYQKDCVCDICQRVFSRKYDLNRHRRIHTGDKPYKCHICGLGFTRSDHRDLHIRRKPCGQTSYYQEILRKADTKRIKTLEKKKKREEERIKQEEEKIKQHENFEFFDKEKNEISEIKKEEPINRDSYSA